MAFALPDRNQWTGGYQYFANLFEVLKTYGRGKVRPVLFVGKYFSGEAFESFGCEIVRSELFCKGRSDSRIADALISGRDRKAMDVYREYDIHVVFESATWHGWRFPFPTIAWLPDFQHRRLPGMFDWRRWLHRDLGYRAQMFSATAIMLSSQAARRDCEEMYPSAKNRISVIPFAVEPGNEAYAIGEEEVRTRYNLDTPYFYLPNQFWRHKNHAVVIDALQTLCKEEIAVTVVASGSQVDPRHPGLGRELVERVERAGLRDRFRFLDLVPRGDMYALMRGAVAVINPSLFEGWSTTVEEAKAMGITLVLSDIPVHQEQAGTAAYYFDAHSRDELAALLYRVIDETTQGSRTMSQAEMQLSNAPRLRGYAQRVEDLIVRVASRNCSVTNVA